jgi:hypothetical protein
MRSRLSDALTVPVGTIVPSTCVTVASARETSAIIATARTPRVRPEPRNLILPWYRVPRRWQRAPRVTPGRSAHYDMRSVITTSDY